MTNQNRTSRPSGRTPNPVAVARAIAELRRGGVVAIRDVERDRVAVAMAAEMVGPDSLSTMRQLAGSSPILALTGHRRKAISGAPVSTDQSQILSVALPSGASDKLIRTLADPTVSESDDVGGLILLPEPPGGYSESAIKLAKLARILPSALVALAANIGFEPTERWAAGRAILMVDAEDIAAYSKSTANSLIQAAQAKVPLEGAEEAAFIAFRPVDGGLEHVAIVIGTPDTSAPVLIRLHSQCLTGDLFGSLRCDCGDQLRGAVTAISEAGGGILLYLAQEGRDIGLVNKLRAYQLQDGGFDTVEANERLGFDADERLYEPAVEMLRQLEVKSVKLLTNNPEKVAQLSSYGIDVVERVPHIFPTNPHNSKYLETKSLKAGHLF